MKLKFCAQELLRRLFPASDALKECVKCPCLNSPAPAVCKGTTGLRGFDVNVLQMEGQKLPR
jgi:hypothetical protein